MKQIDRRFSGEKVRRELLRLAGAGIIESETQGQMIRYGVTDPNRPIRLYPEQDPGKPGVRRGERDPRHEEVIPFEPWEE